MNTLYFGNELYHHGILGQKWGVRRYQNENGTLTAEGRKRYSDEKTEEFKNAGYNSFSSRIKGNRAAKNASLYNTIATTAERKQKDIERKISENKKLGKDTAKLGKKWMKQEESKEFCKRYISDINEMTIKEGKMITRAATGQILFGIIGNAAMVATSDYVKTSREMSRDSKGAAYQAYKRKYGNS